MKPVVVFFHRKPYPTGHYSLEALFAEIRVQLRDDIEARVAECRWYSRGIFRRLYNLLEAPFRQGDVNYITGDVHYLCGLLPPTRTILMIPDCGFLYESSGLRRRVERWWWLTMPVRRSARVVTISEHARGEIIRESGCPPDKVRVIPVPVSARYTHVPKPFNRSHPTLLQIGQASNKNLARIIAAITGLAVRLVTIGELSDANRRALDAAGIDYVNHGRLSEDELLRAYVDCDMLVFPSIYEGFGMPIVEAQKVGRPVVTSTTTSMPWVAGDGACLVDPYSIDSIREGIRRIIADEAYRERLVRNGLENAKRFPVELIARQHLDEILGVAKVHG